MRTPPRSTCNIKECQNKPTWEVRLSLAVHSNHEPAISTPFLYLCDDHKHDVSFESLTPDENWNKICEGFLRMGRMAPKKKYSKILVVPISPDPNLS